MNTLTSHQSIQRHDSKSVMSDFLSVPFHFLRLNYSLMVRTGLIKDSLLGSAKFEQNIKIIEKATLGIFSKNFPN